jgi:16S rRNA (adenine1518-N6/adenine1519-N6)-dimethyltransferase
MTNRYFHAKKSLGQNFLTDPNVAGKIVGALEISRRDTVVEIGPGKGALTLLLATTAADVIAVEKDKTLYMSLKEQLSSAPNVTIINEDFLNYPFPSCRPLAKVVGNIPYNLSSAIISKLVDERSKIDFAVLTLQAEVADRVSAMPGTKEFGSLSVRLQLVAEAKKLFQISPSCFRPRPSVNSRVVKITFKSRSPLFEEIHFVDFVKRAFAMRRKMFRHYVAHYYGKEAVALLPGKYQTNRIETFTPDEIYDLFLALTRFKNDV